MSASQEKKRRREERSEGVEKRQVQHKMSVKTKRKARGITAAVTAVVVVLLVVLIVFNSTLFYSGITAVQVGDHAYKTAEFNYYYKSLFYNAYSNLYNTYGEQFAALFLDPSKDLDKQNYSEEQTWEEYLEEQAFKRMQQVCTLCDAAAEEGWQLTEEAKTELETTISNAKSSYASAGYKSFKQYLIGTYGKGFTEKMFNKLVEQEVIYKYYAQELLNRLEYTDEELDARYDKDEYEYDLITFYMYFVSGAADEANGIDADTAMNEAFSTANLIAGAKTEDVFADMVHTYAPEDKKADYIDPDATRHENVAPSNVSSTKYGEWLMDAARQYGDTTVIESDNGYYVLLFVGRNDNSYNLQNFRHVLVKLDADAESGEYTQTILQAGEDEINDILKQWQEDPTEENFAALANELSDDTGSNTNGGLYEDVAMGTLVPEIETWLFDSSRKAGDTEIIYVKSSNYTGYHLVYYVGAGDRYDRRIAENLLKSEWYDAWMAEREPQYPIDTTIAFKFAK